MSCGSMDRTVRRWHAPRGRIVGGDRDIAAIAAASILAKTDRDAMLVELDREYPVYGFCRHKGYSTPEHLAALAAHGPCPAHRRSFAPVTQLTIDFEMIMKTPPKALLFDVFGTVVDWRGSIIRELQRLGRRKRLRADWAAFADAWRRGYAPAMQRVRRGELPWQSIDALHRMILDGLLREFGLRLNEREKRDLNHAWHRLTPWPDSVKGLTRLKRRYIIGTLSNGNVALLVDMAKHGGLPWDCVLSAELFHYFKPDPEVYLGAAATTGAGAPRGHAGGSAQERSRCGAQVRIRHRVRAPATRKGAELDHGSQRRPTQYLQRRRLRRSGPADGRIGQPYQSCFSSLRYSWRAVFTCEMRNSTGTSL